MGVRNHHSYTDTIYQRSSLCKGKMLTQNQIFSQDAPAVKFNVLQSSGNGIPFVCNWEKERQEADGLETRKTCVSLSFFLVLPARRLHRFEGISQAHLEIFYVKMGPFADFYF